MKSKFSMGVDFGSNSVRALIVDINSGEEVGSASSEYAGGDKGIYTDKANSHLARQCPGSYLESLAAAIKEAVEKASDKKSFSAGNIRGMGIDTTGSTPIPVNSRMEPLAKLREFRDNLNAKAWMWKDHTSMEEAEKITLLASKIRPHYLEKCGGVYSSEWFFSKIWHCLNVDKKVFAAAYSWVEFCDFIPAVLCGVKDPLKIRRGICAAGHKAMYSKEWKGLPDAGFLGKLDKRIAELLPRLYKEAYAADKAAGFLSEKWAEYLGLKQGIPVTVGSFDAHMGAVGAGVGKGELVKIIGTSSCDITVSPNSVKVSDIPGVCGIVDGSVMPGYYGIEAGQAAVGDILNWFVSRLCRSSHSAFNQLTEEAEKIRPGESGLLGLDWNNGNRCVLVDPKLTGMLLGMTLHSSQAEIYRALIEATAFGSRKITDRLEEYGIHTKEIICCGGIAEKNQLFMQIYADVLNKKMKVSASSQTCALGSAIFGAVAAGDFKSVEAAQKKFCSFRKKVYTPIKKNSAVYKKLYPLYSELHDSFGIKNKKTGHYGIMKKLLEISSFAKNGK